MCGGGRGRWSLKHRVVWRKEYISCQLSTKNKYSRYYKTHAMSSSSCDRRTAMNDPGDPPRPAVTLGRVEGGGESGGGGGGVGIVREGG